MAQEIERKFLVKGEFKEFATIKSHIIQGYLSSIPERIVRVRVKGDKGFLTVKGVGIDGGISRYEWEKEIPLDEALELLKICEPGVIDKTRYFIPVGNYTFEVDEFSGENLGLFLAEIELKNESDFFEKPDWLGQEVTGDAKYYNSNLIKNPFSKWNSF